MFLARNGESLALIAEDVPAVHFSACSTLTYYTHAHMPCTHTHTHTCSTEHCGFLAVPFTRNGIVVVALGYDLAPKGMYRYNTKSLHTCTFSAADQGSKVDTNGGHKVGRKGV